MVYQKEKGGGPHECKWNGDKEVTQCLDSNCKIGAAFCVDHEDAKNCSAELLEWFKKESVSTNCFNVRIDDNVPDLDTSNSRQTTDECGTQ